MRAEMIGSKVEPGTDSLEFGSYSHVRRLDRFEELEGLSPDGVYESDISLVAVPRVLNENTGELRGLEAPLAFVLGL